MSRNSWSVYILESDLTTWSLDSTIYIPNNEEGLDFEENSTMTIVSLIDASQASLVPDTTYLKLPITFIWKNVDNTFIEQLRDYQRNAEVLKIVTGISGRDFIGRITNVKPNWNTGAVGEYDLSVTFTPLRNFE